MTWTRTVSLQPFAPHAAGIVQGLDADVTHSSADCALRLRYVLRADLSRLRIPALATPRRKDELWKHTCFEAFLRAREGTAYYELNASPSTEWALYAFDDYRAGMRTAEMTEPPAIRVERDAQALVVHVRLHLGTLPPLRALALAAVIEDDDGSLSYWALKHPAAKPDFHHADAFALDI